MSAKGSKPGKKRVNPALKEEGNRDIRSFFQKPVAASRPTAAAAAAVRATPVRPQVPAASMDEPDSPASRSPVRYRLIRKGTVGSLKPVELDFRSFPEIILGRDSAITNPAKVSLGIPTTEEYCLPISRTQAYLRPTSNGRVALKNSDNTVNEIKVRRHEDGPLAEPIVLKQGEEVEIKPGDCIILDGWAEQEHKAMWELAECHVEAVSPGRENGHPNVKKTTESSPRKRQKLANRGQGGVAPSLQSLRAQVTDPVSPAPPLCNRGTNIRTPSAVKNTPAGDKRTSAEMRQSPLGSPGNPLIIDEDEGGDKKKMKPDCQNAIPIDICSDGEAEGSSDVEFMEVRPSPQVTKAAAKPRTPAKNDDADEVEVISEPRGAGKASPAGKPPIARTSASTPSSGRDDVKVSSSSMTAKTSAKPMTPCKEDDRDEVEVIPSTSGSGGAATPSKSSSTSRLTPSSDGTFKLCPTPVASKALDKPKTPNENGADGATEASTGLEGAKSPPCPPAAPPTSLSVSMPPPNRDLPGKPTAAPAPSSSSDPAKGRPSKESTIPLSPSSMSGPPGILEVSLGDTVCVKARTGPGQNRLGGVATVIGVNDDGTYDVKYVVHSGKERRLSVSLLTPISCNVTEEDRRRRRASAKIEIDMGSPERVTVKHEKVERKVKKRRASRPGPKGSGQEADHRRASSKLSRVKKEPQHEEETEDEEEDEERIEVVNEKATGREHWEKSGAVRSYDSSGDEDEDDGGAAKKVQQYGCRYCSVKFDLTNDPKGKKLRAMQTHVQKCQHYHNKRMREDARTAGQCREEMPSQAAKSLESTLTVPDPTFIVTGIQGWLVGQTSRVVPLGLMSAVFKALRTTGCAQRAQCFYRILCLSLEAHPPHLVLNAWSLGDLNAFQGLLEEVSIMDDGIDYRMLRSQALALSYLTKMFEMERRSLGENPSHVELNKTILGRLASQQSKQADGHVVDLKKAIVHLSLRTCASAIKARQDRGGMGRGEAMYKGREGKVGRDPMDWFMWSDSPEELASVVMCRLAALVLEMMLATSMTQADAVKLIDHSLKQLGNGADTRVHDMIQGLFYEGLGTVGRVLDPAYEKEVLGCLFDDIKAYEGGVEG